MTLQQAILEQKRNTVQEISLHLFEKCNMSCVFCWQDHDSMVGVDSILSKTQIVNEFVARSSYKEFVVNLMGGELFDPDIFSDTLADQYAQVCLEIHTHAAALNKAMLINVVTNLVTDTPEVISQFMDRIRSLGINAELTTSYDAKGRFNRNQFEVFKRNVEILRSYIAGIGVVLTKPSIKQMVAQEDAYMRYLYDQGFPLYFDFYQPGADYATMAPSDVDLLEVFYHLIERFPNAQPINQWIRGGDNKMSCRSTFVVHPDGRTGSCGTFVQPSSTIVTFFKTPVNHVSNQQMEDKLIAQRNCIECEYFKRCTVGCFLLHDFTERTQLPECVFKLAYDKITKGETYDVAGLKHQ